MLRVQIEGLPVRNPSGSRFDARVLDVDSGYPECQLLRNAKLRLGFRGAVVLWPDQKLLAQVKLRPIRGSVSPGAFDHELNSALQGVVLGGYVTQLFALRDPAPQRVVHWQSIDRHRYSVRQFVKGLDLRFTGVVLALATGDTAELGIEEWSVLQNTGTVHLLVISGLHVGLVSALLFFLLRPVAQLLVAPLPGFEHAALLHASLTVAMLLIYVHWVGASVPALRAWLMVAVVLVGWSLKRRVMTHTLVLLAAIGVVAMTPLAGLQAGFWLSFALVVWLLSRTPQSTLAANQDRPVVLEQDHRRPKQFVLQVLPRGWQLLRQVLGLHVGATLLLFPLLAWLGLPVAPVGPLANFFAVPYVTLLLVPWVLLSMLLLPVSVQLSAHLLVVADRLIALLFDALQWLVDVWPAATLSVLNIGVLAGASALVLVTLMPLAAVVRTLAGSALLVWALQDAGKLSADPAHEPSVSDPIPDYGEFNVQVLDVGQGLAVVIATAEAVILYDTGASYPSGFNYVDAVIGPALRSRQVRTLDAFVVSHGDNDHAGGVAAVMERFSPRWLAGAIPTIESCQWHFGARRTSRWLSSGVEFELLNHIDGQSANDKSCVLLIRGTHAKALLTGDIEVTGEQALLSQFPNGVDLVSVAHHGSLTSSSEEFVQKLQPGLAVVSAGYKNRFGHPHPAVVERYKSSGSRVVSTAYEGTIGWQSHDVAVITSARQRRLNHWQLGAPLLVAMDSGQAAPVVGDR